MDRSDLFQINRVTVWKILQGFFQPIEACAYAKPTGKSKDGHMCFNLVDDHYLETNNIDHMATKSERSPVN